MANFQQVIEIENLSQYDFYDLNMEDDIQEAATELTEDVAQNWVLPYPADAEDPDEALLIGCIEKWLGDEAILFNNNYGLGVTTSANSSPLVEAMQSHLGFFEFDEVDETTAAYRDELKEALLHVIETHEVTWEDTTNNNGSVGISNLGWKARFKRPMTFPLNPALKTFYTGADDAVLSNPANYNLRIYYRVVRQPMEFLGRILALMRQELST